MLIVSTCWHVKPQANQTKQQLQHELQVKINKNRQRTIVNIFLPINFNICFGCSKEPSK